MTTDIAESTPAAQTDSLRAMLAAYKHPSVTVALCLNTDLADRYEAAQAAVNQAVADQPTAQIDADREAATADLRQAVDALTPDIRANTAVLTFTAVRCGTYQKLLNQHPDRLDHQDHPQAWPDFCNALMRLCLTEVTLDGRPQQVTMDDLNPVINFGKADEITRAVLEVNGRTVTLPDLR